MRKRTLLPLIAGGAMVAAGTVAWLNRAEIAAGYVDAALAERGVRARYLVDSIGVRRQRLRDVVIGDPARPDLVARFVEVTLGVGWDGPYVTAVRARGLRLNGMWTGERLTLGEIDKLLPEPDGGPFAFPAIDLDLADASARFDTPWGRVGLAAAGHGRLDRAFAADVALSAPVLAMNGCALRGTRGRVGLRIVDGAPAIAGPIGIGRVRCGEGLAMSDLRLGLDAGTDAAFARVRARTGLRGGAARAGDARAGRLRGQLTVDGALASELKSRWQLSATNVDQPWMTARRMAANGSGTWMQGGDWRAEARVALTGGRAGRSAAARLAGLRGMDDSTPFGPVARKLADALQRAGNDFDGSSDLRAWGGGADGIRVFASSLALRAASGARVSVDGEDALRWSEAKGLALSGTTRVGGGGLPEGSVALTGAAGGVGGVARFAPYVADGAVVAFAPVRFALRGGRTRFASGIALSGPLAAGSVERLSFPLVGTVDGAGTISIDSGCLPLRWHGARTGGVVLDAGSVTLCPGRGTGALGWAPARGLTGSVTMPGFTLAGRTGDTPMRLSAKGALLSPGGATAELRGIEAAIGTGDATTRFTADRITAAGARSGFTGSLDNGAGRIGPTPFLLSAANGQWRWAGGALQLETGLMVEDAAAEDRFQPLKGGAVSLRYADGVVRASGRLVERVSGAEVLDIALDHRFATGTGNARFTVAGIVFARDGLQPVDVTRLALGIVANVEGRVRGQGALRWTPEGIASGGSFTTDRLDLAAAFGPVERLSGTIRFDDLLALTTPAGQEARVGSVNPGIEVTDGRVLYQLLPDRQLRVESGVWPFAGGQLLLQPTLLDLGTERPRRLTFDVAGVDAALFLQRYDFENISATGTFDGVMPTVFDADGGRVTGGSLVSRDGGGTLAYVGELSNRDLGIMANMAYEALKSLRYDNLVIRLNGDIDGEMVTEVDFTGLAQGEGAARNLLTRAIARLPFTFRIRINAPFRQLLTSARGLYDPTLLIEQNLPDLLRAERAPVVPPIPADAIAVQPTESEDQR